MLKNKILDESGFKDIDKQVKDEVSNATEFAKNSKAPEDSELFEDIYVTA